MKTLSNKFVYNFFLLFNDEYQIYENFYLLILLIKIFRQIDFIKKLVGTELFAFATRKYFKQAKKQTYNLYY